METSYIGFLEMLQLLATYGADMEAVDDDGDTAQSDAEEENHPTVVAFLDATETWHPVRIAIASRLHTDLKTMLRSGKIDPTGCGPFPILMDTATTATMWEGQPAVCPVTTRLTRTALAAWSPSTHWLHHNSFRTVVHTVLLVAGRLRAVALDYQAVLPSELWLVVLGQLLRRDCKGK